MLLILVEGGVCVCVVEMANLTARVSRGVCLGDVVSVAGGVLLVVSESIASDA